MEYILEMDEKYHLTIPEAVVANLELQPGAHFTARLDAGKFIIEHLPFSSLEQGKLLERTVESLQK